MRLRVTLVALLVAAMVATGSVAGYAAWTAVTAKSASVTAASVAIAQTGASDLAATYKPGFVTVTPVLTDTASVTITNTGTAPLALALSTSGGDATLNSAVTMQVWKFGTTCDSTTVAPGTATSGTLAAPPGLPSDANSATAGAAVVLCIRTSMTVAAFDTAAPRTTTPSLTVTGTVGANWVATASASFTQVSAFNWFQVNHTFSNKCMDANGGSVATGTNMILYPCKTPLDATNNQAFRFQPVAGGYYRIYIGAGTTAGPVVGEACAIAMICNAQLQALGTGTAQQWTITQHGAANNFRLVNRESGMCLTMPNTNDTQVFYMNMCGTSTVTTDATYRTQHFTFTAIP